MLTPKQAGEKLGVTGAAVNAMIHDGRLPAKKVGNGTQRIKYRLYAKDVEQFKKSYRKYGHVNGKSPVKVVELDKVDKPIGIFFRMNTIEKKLKDIERKVDKLIEIWS